MRSYRMSGPQEERRLSPKITTGEEAAHQQKKHEWERNCWVQLLRWRNPLIIAVFPIRTHSSKPRVFTHYSLPLSPEETRKPFSAQAMNILGFEGHNSSVSYSTLFFNYPLKMEKKKDFTWEPYKNRLRAGFGLQTIVCQLWLTISYQPKIFITNYITYPLAKLFGPTLPVYQL